jgi:hypothetical protein
MEARRLESRTPHVPSADGSFDEPFSWHGLFSLIHPYVWGLIAALWIGVACLILYEAG